jgi:hypothetical protein
MEKRSLESIVRALEQHQVQYLIVGGMAVVAHGYVRFTADIDLILSLDEQNLSRAVMALKTLDYRPRAPVPIERFADPVARQEWVREKNMVVFSLFSPLHPATEIDLFVEAPLDFATAHARAQRLELAPGVAATFCSLEDLIDLKLRAGRPRDMQDIDQLRKLSEEGGDE